MDTKMLICEGACNPDVYRIDNLIKRVGRESAAALVTNFARSANYTQHARVGSELYECEDCGVRRRFGGNMLLT
jgi:hypothetical protein